MTNKKTKMDQRPKPAPLLRAVRRAYDMDKPAGSQWTVIQRIDDGLVIGNIGPNKAGGEALFAPDGCKYLLSATALREIADLIVMHGVELAS